MSRYVSRSALAAALSVSCASAPPAAPVSTPASIPASAPVFSAAQTQAADEALDKFFDEVFERNVSRNPELQTLIGVKTDYGKWNDISDARAQENHALEQQDLVRLRALPFEPLSDSAKLNYRVFEYLTERSLERFRWRFHNYSVSQMRGRHSRTAAFLINYHRIASVADAEAYVARLRGVPALFAEVERGMTVRAEKGILPPKFVFPRVIGSCQNLLRGRPFVRRAKKDSPLLADFTKKLDGIDALAAEDRKRLLGAARAALLEAVAPAYQKLIARLKTLEARATTDDGAWKFPDGDAFYAKALEWTNTTQVSAEEIHALGLKEVARIHGEMREIMTKVDFDGDLQAFFKFMRTDPRFYYSDDEAGRAAYLVDATAIIENMKAKLPTLFSKRPEADVVVKRVEAFREKAAGKAFYNRPALDGSTPGYYYANLYNMADMPKYQMEALAYHEAIPGHHMQIALTQEMKSLPKFRKFSFFTAYVEGWGLYSELVPKELGLYSDPYSDFGRLAMELWRACRLVVDTGIHHKRWTREKAIEYLATNTPNPKGDVVKAIERYIVMPSQATAYKVGMLEILRLRARAEAELGDAFDLRAFHDVVLGNGPVPLTILEDVIEAWIDELR